jgi:hypothetical protein
MKHLAAAAEEQARRDNGNVRRRLASRCDGARLVSAW